MKITPDTNVLVRAAVVAGDCVQSAQARAVLREASLIAIPATTLCEFVWVLKSVYKYSRSEIEQAVLMLTSAASVVCDRRMVAFGLATMAQGGDFADGVIAFAGTAAGGDCFVSFDRKAIRALRKAGHEVREVG